MKHPTHFNWFFGALVVLTIILVILYGCTRGDSHDPRAGKVQDGVNSAYSGGN